MVENRSALKRISFTLRAHFLRSLIFRFVYVFIKQEPVCCRKETIFRDGCENADVLWYCVSAYATINRSYVYVYVYEYCKD